MTGHPYDELPEGVTAIFGEEATAEAAYDLLTVDVPVGSWIPALEIARDKLGCTYFDWLSAVDEPGTGFRVAAHVVALEGGRVRRLLLRTTVPHTAPSLPSAIAVYAGASWHERETHEMFGVVFTDHPHLVPLLLPENFEGHPLRKDFVLAARVAKAWPGAKEPGEGADHGGPKRRQMLPPGVPDPNDWGPLKGQLPPAPARPARTPRAAGDAPARRARPAAAGTGEAGEAPVRPVRRARSVTEGSASQAAAPAEPTEAGEAPVRPVRRARSAAQGSASQAAAPAEAPAAPAPDAAEAAPAVRPSDAPWHNARPAFDDAPAPKTPEPAAGPEPAAPTTGAPTPEPAAEPEAPKPEPSKPEPEPSKPEPERSKPEPETSKPEAPKPAAGPTTEPDTNGGDA
ncbi:NADH-quinone oxidoreductase subunit C [Streptomyces sp. NPDC089919]|uniref:NADH-quinone oxidoreductase subunit C n=1 Tax=Streptomyces sp. NPDC089919 TaxID=3155188 RepID=UPI003433256E